MEKRLQNFRYIDGFLLLLVTLLVAGGTIIIGSANGWVYDSEHFSLDHLMVRQLLGYGLGLAAILFLAGEFVPFYIGMLIQMLFLSGCGLLCGLTGLSRCQTLLDCLSEAVRCMAAATILFFGLAVFGTMLLFLVGGG